MHSNLKAAVAYSFQIKVICFLSDYIDYANLWRTSKNERATRIKRPLPGTPRVDAGGSIMRGGGGRGASGFTALQYWAFFQTVFSFGNFDFNVPYCGIIRSALRGFSSLWLTVFGKRRSFTQGIAVPFICALLSNAGQYWNTLDLTINAWLNSFWQLIYDGIGRTSNDRAFRSLWRSIRGLTFSRGDCWGWFLVYTCLRKNKHARWIQL